MKILAPIVLSILWFYCSAQNSNYSLSNNITILTYEKTIKADSIDYTLISFEINNVSADTFLLWFCEKDIGELSKDEIIKEHFFTTKGDFNLIQLATETITDTTILPENIFSFYTAMVKPNSTFNYSFILKNQISENVRDSFQRLLNNQLVVLSQLELQSYFNISILNRIIFKTGNDIIDWNGVKDEILEQ